MFLSAFATNGEYRTLYSAVVLFCLFGPKVLGQQPSTDSSQTAAAPATPGKDAGAAAASPSRHKDVENHMSQSASAVTTSGAVRQANHQTPVSDAERITALNRAIEADQQALTAIEAALSSPTSEYHQAEAEFKRLDARLGELKKSGRDSQDGNGSVDAERSASEIETVQAQWKLAKDRFELAIQERKTHQERAATLRQKLHQEQQTLDKLSGASSVAPPNSQTPAPDQAPVSPPSVPAVGQQVTGNGGQASQPPPSAAASSRSLFW